jgi:WS/DGAT/MGAT family acyltransferase
MSRHEQWSPGPLNGMDTLMWWASADPRMRLPLVGVWLLGQAPEWERFVGCWEGVMRRIPRLTHRVVEPALRLGSPRWMPDPEFRLLRHVSAVRLPEPGGLRQLLDLAEWFTASDFDRARPPWNALLVTGFETGKAAIVMKWHHCLADGIASSLVMQEILTSDPKRSPSGPAGIRSNTEGETGTPSRSWAAVVARPARWARSLPQLAPMPGSPLLAQRSLGYRFEVAETRLTTLRRVAKDTDTSVTSVFVASMLAACEKYHQAHNVRQSSIPVAVPVSLRAVGQTGPGNVLGALRIRGSLTSADPRERIRAVHRAITFARDNLDEELFPVLTGIGSWCPRPLIRRPAPVLAKHIDLWLSNVPCAKRPAYLAGVEFTGNVVFSPRGNSACNATMVSHGDTCAVALNLDPAAFADPVLFRTLVDRCLNNPTE